MNKLNHSNSNDRFILNQNVPKGFEKFFPKSGSSDKNSEEKKNDFNFKKTSGSGGGNDK